MILKVSVVGQVVHEEGAAGLTHRTDARTGEVLVWEGRFAAMDLSAEFFVYGLQEEANYH